MFRAVFVTTKSVQDYQTNLISQLVRSRVGVAPKLEHANAFMVQSVMENSLKVLNVLSTMEFVQRWANGLNGQNALRDVMAEQDLVKGHVTMEFPVKRVVLLLLTRQNFVTNRRARFIPPGNDQNAVLPVAVDLKHSQEIVKIYLKALKTFAPRKLYV